MNKFTTLKLVRLLLISLLFFSLTFNVQAQGSGIRITGTVVDSKGQQLSGVSVKVKGGTTGSTTDGDGKYSIAVPNVRSVIVFSYIGFVSVEELVGARKIINVKLLDDSKAFGKHFGKRCLPRSEISR